MPRYFVTPPQAASWRQDARISNALTKFSLQYEKSCRDASLLRLTRPALFLRIQLAVRL